MIKRLSVIGISLVFISTAICYADWINVPAFAFNGKTGEEIFVKSELGKPYLTPNQPGREMEMYAPVYFPASAQGKKVRRISVKLHDGTGDGLVAVTLYKVKFKSGEKFLVISAQTSSDDDYMGDMIVNSSTGQKRWIDNSKYSWYLRLSFLDWMDNVGEKDLWLYSVRIEYN